MRWERRCWGTHWWPKDIILSCSAPAESLCLTHSVNNPKWGFHESLRAALLPGECVGMQGASTLRWGAKLPKCSPVRPCFLPEFFPLASCSQVALDGHPESWWMNTRAQEQTISHPVISIFRSDFDRYSCERLCLFREELSQEDTEQAGKSTSSFPVVICVDNKPLAGFHNKRQVISPGMHSVCLSKGTFIHLLQVPPDPAQGTQLPELCLAHQAVNRTWRGELRVTSLLFSAIMAGPSPDLSSSTWTKANPSAETAFPCKPWVPPHRGVLDWKGP